MESNMPDASQNKLEPLEKRIVLAFRQTLREGLVSEDSTVLQKMLDDVAHDVEETSHQSQFRWEGIDDAFKLKAAGSPYEDALTSAFFQTHTYKYLDNPTFKLSFERELRQRAVPTSEMNDALGHVDSLIADLQKNPGELDAGWNSDMEGLVDLTSNADNRDAKPLDPHTGGGVYPENDSYDKGTLEGF
jgi:hypothetical protein